MSYLEIKFKDQIDTEWSSWFNNLEINHLDTGGSFLSGCIEDISALYGLLEKIRNLGIEPVFLKYEIGDNEK